MIEANRMYDKKESRRKLPVPKCGYRIQQSLAGMLLQKQSNTVAQENLVAVNPVDTQEYTNPGTHHNRRNADHRIDKYRAVIVS